MEGMRKPFLVLALVVAVLIVIVEGSAAFLLKGQPASRAALQRAVDEQVERDPDLDRDELLAQMVQRQRGDKPPGLAIPLLAPLDTLLISTVGLMTLALWMPERIQGRVQGIISLVVSFLLLLACILRGFAALGLLLIMVGLFLAPPFGTLAYIATWGFFDVGGASAVLSLLMFLKLGLAICLVLAHQRLLKVKALVLLVLTSLLANVIVAFLHAFPPGILVSIADAIAAIVNAILGAIWAVVFLITGLWSVVKLLRVDRLSS